MVMTMSASFTASATDETGVASVEVSVDGLPIGTQILAGRVGLNDGQGLGTGDINVAQGAILGIGGVTLANDVTGAGDTVIASMAALVAAGMSLREALPWANRAGGLVVGKFGTATISYEELFA